MVYRYIPRNIDSAERNPQDFSSEVKELYGGK